MGSFEALPSPPLSDGPRILFLDVYDSFSNNITSQLTTLLGVDVSVLPIDAPISKEQFRRELRHYEAVVCGPGPGSPENEADVGLMRWLWDLDHDDLLPVLGVCLGFQSLVLACGGGIRRLRRGLHGMVRPIQHRSLTSDAYDSDNIFRGSGHFKATLYHSLCADVGQDAVVHWDTEKWSCPSSQPDVVPLAWVEEDRGNADGTERVLMALKHRTRPFWGLQYHPESVCTEEAGNKVVQNWMAQALAWNVKNRRTVDTDCRNMLARSATRACLLHSLGHADGGGPRATTRHLLRQTWRPEAYESRLLALPHHVEVPDIAEALDPAGRNHIILDSANGDQPPPRNGVDVRGRFSIIALAVDQCIQIHYHTGDASVRIVNGGRERGDAVDIPLSRGQTVWTILAGFHALRSHLATSTLPDEDDVPFLGGFTGFVTYEQGLGDIGAPLPANRGHKRPDVCLAWVTKSVVVDHQKRLVHIQNLGKEVQDHQWLDRASAGLTTSAVWRRSGQGATRDLAREHEPAKTSIRKPAKAKYEAKVRMCQEYIAAGESYELCLTDQTRITTTTTSSQQYARPQAASNAKRDMHEASRPGSAHAPSTAASPWPLYRTLRRRNPAPFAAYLRLGGATLLSSSPERFLQYTRAGRCAMTPMKGTVPKAAAPGGAGGGAATLAEAEALLHTPKEAAENLMIVDLVRHDLHGICGAGRVTVPALLKVEEYQTVYTMVTRVEGQLPDGPAEPKERAPCRGRDADDNVDGQEGGAWAWPWSSSSSSSSQQYSGLDVLAASLPPGSMTGAPKKRSCEILQQIEDGRERSLYSGVVGYMCVTGRGDWSVTIRSLYRWDDETEAAAAAGEDGHGDEDGDGNGNEVVAKKEVWHIGAGGAVTILSTPQGESEEMFVKLARPLSIFAEEGLL